uniref:Frizzled receptor n=1 Tax=Ciona intestinalis TaxID=7719 RepID=F6S8I5_CIOIN
MDIKLGIIILCCVISEVSTSNVHPQCRPVTLPMCLRNDNERNKGIKWIYNETTFPNFNNDASESEVEISLSLLHPLLSTSCSRYLELFLCSVFSPACMGGGVVPPCRSLCEVVFDDCAEVVEAFGIIWPQRLHCDNFPPQNGGKMVDTGSDTWGKMVVSRSSWLVWGEALLGDGEVCIPLSGDDVITPALSQNNQEIDNVTKYPGEYGLRCPAQLTAPPNEPGYTFLGMQGCGAPCPNMYMGDDELMLVRYIICVLASLCALVTSFVLFTFAIDTNRFRYPERPIVFYAAAYFVISVIFLVGFALGSDVACKHEIMDENNIVIQGAVVVEGPRDRACTIVFMILYFFTVNGTIWWLILTVTWLLAAGFKWGSEAIEKHHLYYHGLAWGIPAVQTMVVVTTGKIEGDNIAGVCFVGLYDSDGLRFLLLLPMSFYLLVGMFVLLTGFICLNRVRKSLHDDETNKKKLAKFMLRIGVFSILYILPQLALIAIYAIEDSNRKSWESAWFVRNCGRYGVPCPNLPHPVAQLAQGNPLPGVFIFCMKYIMTLIVALPPLFWVASKKTMASWKEAVTKQRCMDDGNPLSVTQTQLLNDSNNGPHARDAVRKQQSKHSDVIFGGLGGFQGSSASIAAAEAMTSSRARARQELWEDMTSTDSTLSSRSESTLAKVLEYESHKNKGRRVVGRRRHNQGHPLPLTHNPDEGENNREVDDVINKPVPIKMERNNRIDDVISSQSRSLSDVTRPQSSVTSQPGRPDVVKKQLSISRSDATRSVPDIIKTTELSPPLLRNKPEIPRKPKLSLAKPNTSGRVLEV